MIRLVLLFLAVAVVAQSQNGYQPNTATPPSPQKYTGAPFVYKTTRNPTLDAMKAAGIQPNRASGRNTREIIKAKKDEGKDSALHQYPTSTYSPYNQFNPNGNNFGYNGGNSMYGHNNNNNQYPYTNQQLAYNPGMSPYNSQYQNSNPSYLGYLLRDQGSNYNYHPNQYGYSNGYNGQPLFNPLTNQYTSPSSYNTPNGYGSNWNTNQFNNNQFAGAFKRSERRRRQSSAQFSTTPAPFYSSSAAYQPFGNNNNNNFVNPQFDPNPGNANPASLIQNPNYKYLPPGLEGAYLTSYSRMYDQSGNSRFPNIATQPPILSNDGQNQLNYQKIQSDYVGGRDRYQQDNSEVTNNIYGYDYSSSSTRFGRK